MTTSAYRIGDSGMRQEGSVVDDHVDLPHRAVVPVELVHAQHGAALSLHARNVHLGLRECRVTHDYDMKVYIWVISNI